MIIPSKAQSSVRRISISHSSMPPMRSYYLIPHVKSFSLFFYYLLMRNHLYNMKLLIRALPQYQSEVTTNLIQVDDIVHDATKAVINVGDT
ncbi:hypothetical protein ABKN59_010124 [Abortiporus biennis]